MPRQSLLDLADKIHDGAVVEYVTEQRNAKVSLFDIALAIRDRFSVEMTPQALDQWCKRNGIRRGDDVAEAAP